MIDSEYSEGGTPYTPAIVILPSLSSGDIPPGQSYEVCASSTLSQDAVAQHVSGKLGDVWQVVGLPHDCPLNEDRTHWMVEEVKYD